MARPRRNPFTDVLEETEVPDIQTGDEQEETGAEPALADITPPAETAPPDNVEKPRIIVSKIRAGKTIIAVTGKPVVFNDKGEAEVSERDYLYLRKIPGFG